MLFLPVRSLQCLSVYCVRFLLVFVVLSCLWLLHAGPCVELWDKFLNSCVLRVSLVNELMTVKTGT